MSETRLLLVVSVTVIMVLLRTLLSMTVDATTVRVQLLIVQDVPLAEVHLDARYAQVDTFYLQTLPVNLCFQAAKFLKKCKINLVWFGTQQARNSLVLPVNLAGIGIPIKTKEYVANVQTQSLDAHLAQLPRDVINVMEAISPITFKMSACNISKIVRLHLRTTLMMESTSFALNAKLDFIKIFKMEIVTLAVFLSHVSAVLTQLTALPAPLEKF